MSSDVKCTKCNDKGYILYQPLDGFTHYQWSQWYKRRCDCQRKER